MTDLLDSLHGDILVERVELRDVSFDEEACVYSQDSRGLSTVRPELYRPKLDRLMIKFGW